MSQTSQSPFVTSLLEIGVGVGLVAVGGVTITTVGIAVVPVLGVGIGIGAVGDGIRRGYNWATTPNDGGRSSEDTTPLPNVPLTTRGQTTPTENVPKETTLEKTTSENISSGTSQVQQIEKVSAPEKSGPIPVTINWSKPSAPTYVPDGIKLTKTQLGATTDPPDVPLVYRATVAGKLKELKPGDLLDAGDYEITAALASTETHAAKPVSQRLTVNKARAGVTWDIGPSDRRVTLQERTWTFPADWRNATFSADPNLAHRYSKEAFQTFIITDDAKREFEASVVVTDLNYEGEKTLKFSLTLSSTAKAKKRPSNEPRDPNVIGYPATAGSLFQLYEEIGGKAPSGQFYTVCAPNKAGGHYTYKGKVYDMYHNSSGSHAKDNSRTAWTILVNGETRVVGVGYHTGEVTYRAIFPNATDKNAFDSGPAPDMEDADK
jgi:hypothetical protein